METHPKRARAGTPHKLIPYMVSFMAGGLVLAALLGGYVVHNTSVGKSALEAFARSLGYDAFLETGIDKLALVRAVPGNFVRDVDMPRIVLDIKFEHWQKILVKRNGALARGILIQEAGDFVPTSIRYSDGKTTRTAKAKLRLKGDWIDHLQGKKWSFRIRTKGKDQFFGMRRFSLQKPETRTFQLAPMFLSLTRDLGIISLRYFFADVTINGTHIGVMAVEEHPAKELLEASGRKESVIIRFSEKYLWNARVKSGGGASEDDIFDDYRMAPIDAFQSSRIAKSSTLSNNYRVAAGLLRGFTDGRLSPSEVFDAELMGRFLAAAELFGARHGIIWHNLRFYYNPQTALLEPLPFDMTSSSRWDAVVTTGEPIIEAMLADQAIGRAFRARLKMLIASVESDELLKSLAETEARHLPRLQSEYVLHGRFPLKRLAKRASMLTRAMFGSGDAAAKRYDQIVFARDHSDGRQRILTLFNAVAEPVTVSRVYVAVIYYQKYDSKGWF